MADVSVLVLTFNERIHLDRCIRSVRSFATRVVVVDSGSTDGTRELAEALGADVYENPWVNYAYQVNWALRNCDLNAGWIMRLDADEWVTNDLAASISKTLDELDISVTGLRVLRQMVFLGRTIKRGGVGNRLMLRVWRAGLGSAEQRWMDEHIVLERGEVRTLPGKIVDENNNSLTWWTTKHNSYASREAVDILLATPSSFSSGDGLDRQARRIRFLKQSLYYRAPAPLRGFMYFAVRYFLLLGFLDGRAGLYFHLLQGMWYRTLVDAKIYEIQRTMHAKDVGLDEAVRSRLGIELPAQLTD